MEMRTERTHIVNTAMRDDDMFSRRAASIPVRLNTKPASDEDAETESAPEKAAGDAPKAATPQPCEHCTAVREERQSFRRRR